MVQKSAPRRGRPRAYDPDTALARARDAFWAAGYAATSLDDLSAATGMNRPSLYGAFGDKHALYRTVLDRYVALGRDAMKAALADGPLRDGLRRVYDTALAIYFSGPESARGCFLIGTAVTEAVGDDDIRAALAAGLRDFDREFEERLQRARQDGEIARGADPATLAKLASSVMYFLAIRSRTGETRAALRAFAEASIDTICGPAPAGNRRR